MGLFGGGNSTSNQYTNNVTTNTDRRIAATEQAVVVSVDGNYDGDIRVERVDQASLDTARGALDAGGRALDTAGGVLTGIGLNLTNAVGKISGDNAATVQKMSADLRGTYDTYASNTRQMASDYAENLRANATDAYNFSRFSLDNSLNFARDSLNRAGQDTDTALATIRNTTSSLLDYITQREKDPNERSFQQTLPWLVGGAVIIAMFAFGARSN